MMMIDQLRKRKTTRNFISRSIEEEKRILLEEALLRSPSSKNKNPCFFIFVSDPEISEGLRCCKPHGVKALGTAPLSTVICADETISDVWIEDCSIASILLQLTAQSLGLGSCWIQIRNRFYDEKTTSEEYLRHLLQVPEKIRILSIIAIGYPVTVQEGKSCDELQPDKIRINRF